MFVGLKQFYEYRILVFTCSEEVLLFMTLPSFLEEVLQLPASLASLVAIHMYTSPIGIKSKRKTCRLRVNLL